MIGKHAEKVLNRAVRYAFENGHEYFTLEHVLLSLLEEPEVLEIIQACGGSYTELKHKLEKFLEEKTPRFEEKELSSEEDDEILNHPVATLSIQRMIQRALFQVQSSGKDEITPEDLFVALFQAKDSFSVRILKKQGIEKLDVVNYLSHGIKKDEDLGGSLDTEITPETLKKPSTSREDEALSQFCLFLNRQAQDGMMDPLIGRKKELHRMIQVLCRRRKNNPLLVGEAGVGKTALAEGLALEVVAGTVPEPLKNIEIYALDLGSLLAGTKFRGDFEQRLKRVLKSLQVRKDKKKRPILLIDEIHTLVGAGAVSGGALDAANLLKPLLSRGKIQCIGTTTYQEQRNSFEKDQALARRFQVIEIDEPSIEETISILNGLKPAFELHHGIRYKNDAIRACVELSVRYLSARYLPDKAIDILDEVGAQIQIQNLKRKQLLNKINKEDNVASEAKKYHQTWIGVSDVEKTIAQMAKIPERSVSNEQKKRLKHLTRDLKLVLFGQDHAIEQVVSSIRLARSGLRSEERPIGSFLFCGPTGVGKTELSKQLAHALGVPFLRFDMSEYMEKHTVSRLIGAPPGYVGFEQPGQLTEQVRKQPYAVVLLDEVEKAHSDVWNILLQIMDYGKLTDNLGRKTDFSHTILVLTTNVGSREYEKRPVGIGAENTKNQSSLNKKEIEKTFSPEFRNRLDAIVYFKSLDLITIAQVVGKELVALETQALRRGVEVEIQEDVRAWLAEKGYDPKLGARPLRRLIQEKLKRPLSEEILFGSLEHGGHAIVSLDPKNKDQIIFSFKSSTLKNPTKKARKKVLSEPRNK